ncbi:GNAT family N-acetyltransferase [Brachybacterium sp. AOP25-B2-12]|uniref:GNAT family N-acetyltransferase n=1 Tax=Brachybacterium sp. AOP25-B2-12 TaxID=3457710 RepID=UPI004034CA81
MRPASPADLAALQEIEEAADRTFEPLLGPRPFGDERAPTGEQRATEPGFVLAAVDGTAVVGFAHVLVRGPEAHLEQLAVLPSHHGQGVGTALIEAACDTARALGHRSITLRTYADIPFNAPLYARRGFRIMPDPDTPLHRALVEAEEQADLFRHGARVTMLREL